MSRRPLFARLGAAILCLLAMPVLAGEGPRAAAQRFEGAIRIDGRLDEADWERAARMELGTETFPGENLPAKVRTEFLFGYDDRHVYVAFRASDPEPEAIRAHLADRDQVARNDLVGVVLDTFDDQRRGYAFMVNPLGVQMDALVRGVGASNRGGYPTLSGAPDEDYSWDAIWESAGRIDDEGYVVEIAIPLTALRFSKELESQRWGIVPFRSYPRVDRTRLQTNAVDRSDICWLCQAAKLEGLENIRPGIGLEFSPTLTGSRTDVQEDGVGGLESGDVETDAGLTARWGVTPNLGLAGTINPDFSQVEADAAQLDINRRFALFFPEKRPFFLEGSNFFDSPTNLIYTRTVAEPRWGVKLTGKEGDHAIGTFIAEDRGTTLLFPASQSSSQAALDERYRVAALRYRYDLGRASSLGVVYTDREGAGEYGNRVYGADTSVALSDADRVTVQLLRTDTLYPEDVALEFGQPTGRFEGSSTIVEWDHDSREWFGNAYYRARSAGFRADAGFVTQVDFENYGGGVRRSFWGGEGDWYDRLRAGAYAARRVDGDGRLLNEFMSADATFNGAYQSFGRLGVQRSRTRYLDKVYDTDRVDTFFNIRPTGDFTSSLDLEYERAINFFFGGAPAHKLRVRPEFTLNIGTHLFVAGNHLFEELHGDAGRFFRADITQFRTVYQFDVRTFLRAIFQYTSVKRDVDAYRDAYLPGLSPADLPDFEDALDGLESRSRRFFAQFLFSYKVNPRTLVFVGYSESRLGTMGSGLDPQERTLFVKLGYAWVL